MNRFATAALAVIRDNHVSQPTCIAAKEPKASRAYRYGPPASWKYEDTSAKHAAITAIPARATKYAAGLSRPRRAAITAGSPKMLPPIMVFSIRAARLQRPIARTNCGGLSGTDYSKVERWR